MLVVSVFSILTMQAGATCSGCGCIASCPTIAEIQQRIWMKEAVCFLYSDDCCYGTGTVAPFGVSTSAGNDTADYYLSEADRFYLAGSYDQAAELYRKALEIDPYLQNGWLNMGNALFFMRRYEESLNAYDSVLNLDPKNENALLGKSEALSALNRTDEAKAVMNAVERLQDRKITEIGVFPSAYDAATSGAITGVSTNGEAVEPIVVGSRQLQSA